MATPLPPVRDQTSRGQRMGAQLRPPVYPPSVDRRTPRVIPKGGRRPCEPAQQQIEADSCSVLLAAFCATPRD